MAESKPPIQYLQKRKAVTIIAIPRALPDDVIDARPLADQWAASITITFIKTPHVEVIRKVLPAGFRSVGTQSPREIIVQCVKGDITFTTMREPKKRGAGEMLYLATGKIDALEAVDDSSILLTIMRPEA